MEEKEVFEQLVNDLGSNALPVSAAFVVIGLVVLAMAVSLAGRLGTMLSECRTLYTGLKLEGQQPTKTYQPNSKIMSQKTGGQARRKSDLLV